MTPIDSSLCVRTGIGVRDRRFEIIRGPCQAEGDFPTGDTCTQAKRCVTPKEMKASKAEATKGGASKPTQPSTPPKPTEPKPAK
jgi:hypothetical protein